jgi:ABC-2 type transport system ATP-binding protein
MLSGLLIPSSGLVEVLGTTPFDRQNDFLRKISLVMGQKQNLWWDLPPLETFEIHKSIYNIKEKDFKNIVEELVEMLEIQDCLQTQTRRLSLGQRMRCELAVSLLHRPAILFLDEPTIGLDILMQKKIRSFLLDYHERFKPTILLTTHYMDDVAALAQRVIVIDLGQKVFDGSLKYLTDKIRPDKHISVLFNQTPPSWLVEKMGVLELHQGMLYKFSIERNKISETAAELYSTGLVADLTIEDPPLKDIIGELFSSVRDSNNAIS